jgi:hypothetical protein
MITGAFIGFIIWLSLFLIVVGSCSIVYRGRPWNLTPNYGGMVVFILLFSAIGYFLQ